MKTALTAFISGSLFGLGLCISQMTDPVKVRSFLDLFGNWDPSLAFVMGGALIVSFIGYRIVFKQNVPKLADAFALPTRKDIDARLIIGAAFFGIGWGLIGLCPGPALANSVATVIEGSFARDVWIFLGAMGVSVVGYRVFVKS